MTTEIRTATIASLETRCDERNSTLVVSGTLVSEPGTFIIEATVRGARTNPEIIIQAEPSDGALIQRSFELAIDAGGEGTPRPDIAYARIKDQAGQQIAAFETGVTSIYADAPHFVVSQWAFDEATMRMNAIGFILGRQPSDTVELFVNGELWNIAQPRPRNDVSSKMPWLTDREPGWQANESYIRKHLDEPMHGLAVLKRKGRIVEARSQIIDTANSAAGRSGVKGQWAFLPLAGNGQPDYLGAAHKMTPAGRRRLLASRAFHSAWSQGNGTPAFTLRHAIAETMAKRHELSGEVDIRLLSGDLVRVSPESDKVIARQFLLKGTYEPGLIDTLARLLPAGGCFYDVGACYGHISMAMARAVGAEGQVVSIEANPYTAERLRLHFDLNSVRNGTIFETAVSDGPGTLSFQCIVENAGCSRVAVPGISDTSEEIDALMNTLTVVSLEAETLGKPVLEAFAGEGRFRTVKVSATTIDAIIRETGAVPDVMKMDIEGAELLALRGAPELLSGAFGKCPVIALEYSNLFPTIGGKREDIFALLMEYGYTAFRMAGGKSRGGELIEVVNTEDAPDHDDLIFVRQ